MFGTMCMCIFAYIPPRKHENKMVNQYITHIRKNPNIIKNIMRQRSKNIRLSYFCVGLLEGGHLFIPRSLDPK